MPEQKIESRISEEENGIIQGIFAGRDDLLKMVRNLFLGHLMTDDEKATIRSAFASEKARKVMYRIFIPELEKNDPVNNMMVGTQDLLLSLNLKDKSWDEYRHFIDVSERVLAMLHTAIKLLENPDSETVDLSVWESTPWAEGRVEALLARNNFIVHVNQQVFVLKVKADTKKETIEETKQRLVKNSTK
jgi:hypothetical protein